MLSGQCLSTFVHTASLAISEGCTVDQLTLLSTIFSQIGDTLATIAAQQQCCENQNGKVIES